MNKQKIAEIVAGVLVLGLLICPRNPNVDANRLLREVIAADQRMGYTVTQEFTCLYRGKTLRARSRIVHKPGGSHLTSLVLYNYIPLVEGQERVAGRDAWVLRLKPRQKRFPWKQLWVDKRTSIILASRDWSCANHLKRSMKTIGAIQRRSSSMSSETGPSQVRNLPVIAPTYIPAGFELVSVERDNVHPLSRTYTSQHPEPCRRVRVDLAAPFDRAQDAQSVYQLAAKSGVYLVYSDGLYSICIYINKITEQGTRFAAPRDWGQGLILTGRTKGRKIVVTADLPPKEIERIARSIGR